MAANFGNLSTVTGHPIPLPVRRSTARPVHGFAKSPIRGAFAARVIGIAVGVAVVLNATQAPAHHAFAVEYDASRPITLTGTITSVQWVNPHSRLFIDVTGPDGTVTNWTIEFGAVEALLRRGWKKSDLVVGAEVTINGYLARKGSRVAGRNVTLSDGSKLLGRSAPSPRLRLAVFTTEDPPLASPPFALVAVQTGRGAASRGAASAVLARVNGEAIERWEVDAAVRDFDASSGHGLPAEWRDEVVRSLLEEVIEQHLLAQLAQTRRMDVSEAAVQQGMQEIRDGYPSAEAFRKASGDMTPERFRQRTRRALLAARLLRAEIDSTIAVTDKEARAYYDENLPRLTEGRRTPPPFAELRRPIVDYLTDQQRERKTDAFLKDAKARAKIEVY
jgi:hypothetical protein